jgi:selenocysteine lyase/cysteine desulfurase
MNASLGLLLELGPAVVAEHVMRLAGRLTSWAAGRSDVRLVTPSDPIHRAGVIAIAPRDPRAASARLAKAGVVHALREGAIRLSPHGYNTLEEVDRALEIMEG